MAEDILTELQQTKARWVSQISGAMRGRGRVPRVGDAVMALITGAIKEIVMLRQDLEDERLDHKAHLHSLEYANDRDD